MTRQNIHLIQNNHIYTIGLQKNTKYAGFKFFFTFIWLYKFNHVPQWNITAIISSF